MSTKHHNSVRKFNRAVLNPIMKLFAGRFFYSLVYHVGRSSGKEYTTPVVATHKGETIFIPLPYGADTDWFLNVQAKGECTVKIQGKRYPSFRPVIVDAATALPAFQPFFRKAFQRAGIQQYLQLGIK